MDVVIILLLILFTTSYIINYAASHFRIASTRYLWILFGVHALMTLVYFVSAALTSSDSVAYYDVAKETTDWFSLYESGTKFIAFLAYITVNFLGLSYYAVMIIFSFFGFLAVLLFYLVTSENVTLRNSFAKFSYVEIVFLLPNLHYWTASLGKGSTIVFGLALFTFGLSRFNRRLSFILLGGFLTYMVRPHIFFAMVTGIMLGILITTSGIKWYFRWLIFILAGVIFYSISGSVTEFAETESLNFFESDALSHRVSELSRSAGSGVNIQNYNFFFKMFTFWFRPLFVDGLTLIGLFASFENAFYLYMFYLFISKGLPNFRDYNGWFRICLIFFLLGSVILAQVSGNLGIAMRQKAQMMPFFFIVFCKALTFHPDFAPQRLGRLRPA